MEPVEIQGRRITFPVEVRRAQSWAATFVVPAERAQAMIAHTPLRVAQPWRGKALVSIPFVRYEDSDLDAYREVGIAVVVAPYERDAAGTLALARGRVGVFIKHLPVNQSFTLEAGRAIWGYPKTMADISIISTPAGTTCDLRQDGRHVLSLTVQDGRFPMPSRTVPTYTFLDGMLRRTRWVMPGVKVRGRRAGASLLLGDHPIADELRALGLPRRALMTQTIPMMRARFEAAEILSV